MPTASTTTWGQAIDRLLADGQWHHRDEVLDAAIAAVPPGVAYRTGERRRTAGRPNPRPEHRTRGDQATAVATGAREIARETLRTRVRNGTVHSDGSRVRRRPTR